MSTKPSSFCIRPSNSKLKQPKANISTSVNEPQTENEPLRNEGSAKGLVIRSSSNDTRSIEDYH